MIAQMTRAITAKKEYLYKIQPGSVISTEPKLVWIKMLQHMATYEKILTVHSKYNAMLECILAEKRDHYVIDINPILRDAAYFNRNNELNGEGRVLHWKEIDECIKMFDYRKLTLHPRKDPLDKREQKSDSAAQLRFKLPLVVHSERLS